MISLGLDVHVRNSYLRAQDADGRPLVRGRCANTPDDFTRLLEPLAQRARDSGQPVRAVLESTTNSRAVARLLERYGQEQGLDLTAEVLDARRLRVIAESVCKCDQVDAAVLCELAASNFRLPACYVPDDEVFALREHLRARADLVQLRTMLKNRVQALLHRRGILRPEALDLFSKAGRQYLTELALDEAGRAIADRFLKGLDEVEALVAASTRALRALAGQPRWRADVARLRTMPGVGLVTALVILAELGRFDRFHSRAQLANFAGLVPVQRGSNDKDWRGGITGRGPGLLRAVLTEAAWVAVRKAPVYAALFERVRGRRGKAQVAIVAVARRLLEDAWTLWRKQESFRYAPAAPPTGVAAGVAG
jgi:transposase